MLLICLSKHVDERPRPYLAKSLRLSESVSELLLDRRLVNNPRLAVLRAVAIVKLDNWVSSNLNNVG